MSMDNGSQPVTRAELKEELALLKVEFKEEFVLLKSEIRSEFKSDLGQLKVDLKKEILDGSRKAFAMPKPKF